MEFKPQTYKFHPYSKILEFTSVIDNRGNLRYCVRFVFNGKNLAFLFESLSSANDFITCNFK